jgi:hypothetical protein
MNIRTIGVAASSQVKRVCTAAFVTAIVFLIASVVQAQMCKSESSLNATERQGFKDLYNGQLGMSTTPEGRKFFIPDGLKLYWSENDLTWLADDEGKMNHLSEMANFAVNFLPNPGAVPSEGPGIHYSDSSVFLKTAPVGGNADFSFTYGASSVSDYQALSGDWNGDGIDTIGLYNPVTSGVFLAGANASGSSGTIQFQYGAPGQGYIAIAGDWDGNGSDTIGLYDPVSGFFFLRNTNTPGSADITFQFGAAGAGYVPIAGDYDGDGDDSVGLFHPSGGVFFLRNSNSAGSADITFGYGPGTAEYVPVVGDWNGDGVDTIGVVAVTGTSNGTWFLRNSNSAGAADVPPFTFAVGGGHPIAGDWN